MPTSRLKNVNHLVRKAVEVAGNIPVITSIGALRTRDILQAAEDAQKAGVSGVLLAPVCYQKLTEDEVFTLYETVSASLSVPLCVYENPATTHFDFSDELLINLGRLPKTGSIKLSGGSPDPARFSDRVGKLRAALPAHVSLGVSGDAFAVEGLISGCQVWYSVMGGLFPEVAVNITRHALVGRKSEAQKASTDLEPLWAMFRKFGSLRVIAAAASIVGLAEKNCLPLPLKVPGEDAFQELSEIILQLSLK